MIYKIMSGESIVYQSDNKDDYFVLGPSLERGVQEAGSLSFTVPPTHYLYDKLEKACTFISVYRDNDEIFYGRTLSAQKTLYKELEVTCEGAFTFLLDSEMSKGTYKETISAFMSRCLDAHNSQVENEKKFTLGNITLERASKNETLEFNISDYTPTKNVMESLLLNQYGGYFRVRYNPEGYHFLDYLDYFVSDNNEESDDDRIPIKIGENVIDRTDAFTGENFMTIIRPIGKNGITIKNLSDSSITLSGITKNEDCLILTEKKQEYGSFTKTMSFPNASTPEAVLHEAEEYIKKTNLHLPANISVSYVDFCFINPGIEAVDYGEVFDNIEGFPDQSLIVYSISNDLENPANDSLVFKNAEELLGSNNISSSNSLTRSAAAGMAHSCKVYKYISERDNKLLLIADEVEASAINMTAVVSNLEILAGTVGNISSTVEEIQGSGIWLNRDLIVQVVGTTQVERYSPGEEGYDAQNPNKVKNIKIIDGAGLQLTNDETTKDVVAKPTSVALGTFLSGQMDAGLLIQRLNNGASLARLHADQIELDGDVIVGTIDGHRGFIAGMGGFDNLYCDTLYANERIYTDGSITAQAPVYATDFYLLLDNDKPVSNAIETIVEDPNPPSGKIGFIYTTLSGDTGTVNFNIAATQKYRDDVAAAQLTGWETAAALTSPPSSGTGQTFVFSAPRYYEKNPGEWVREQVNYNFAISKGSTPGSTGYAAVSLNGTTVGQISIGNWYEAGWTDSYAAFVLDPNTMTQPLNPGGSVTIKMRGKSSSSASLADVDDVTISARSLNLQNKTGSNKVTSNGTITADSGYDGLGTVEIDVPTGGSSQPVLSNAQGGYISKHMLAIGLGVTESDLVQCFSSSTISWANRQYFGFKVTAGSAPPKYYYFYINI